MKHVKPEYRFDDEGWFEIVNYNWSKPLSSFLPGIAGIWGVPSWCYFVNRNQLICSLGVHDKDGAILEFISFNQALNLVGQTGFRTFIRINSEVYEPFIKRDDPSLRQTLWVRPHELMIEELNRERGLDTKVLYFPLVDSPAAGLFRKVEIRNTSNVDRTIEVIDGAARLIPYGTSFEHQKVTARHVEALMQVSMVDDVAVYRLKQTAADEAQVGKITGAHFMASRILEGKLKALGAIIDPRRVFGDTDQFTTPWAFQEMGLEEILDQDQLSINQTPCAFSSWQARLDPGESFAYVVFLGHAKTPNILDDFVQRMEHTKFIHTQRQANQEVIQSVTDCAATVSSDALFDAYCEHTFLDNVIRGGRPYKLGRTSHASIIQVYGRQNADLERDYHWLELEPTYLSQGNGHYRSVYQNRRMDSWFFPWVGDRIIKQFMNLIQLDGYNPLDVNIQRYQALDPEDAYLIIERVDPDFDRMGHIGSMIRNGFSPGELALLLDEAVQVEKEELRELLDQILSECEELEVGGLHVGYWVDHWLYNLDAIEVFLSIFPDRLFDILLDDPTYTFFDNPDIVLPRSLKTFVLDGKVRRYGAVKRDAEKERMIAERRNDPHKVRDREGEIYHTTLLVKLLCMVVTKAAALDPLGLGIEMEADKPGWNDSLNGLPGMFGSSLCQSLVLIRALRFLISSVEILTASGIGEIVVYEELVELLTDLTKVNHQSLNHANDPGLHRWWDERVTLLETYRDKTRLGVDGKEVNLSMDQLNRYLKGALRLVEYAILTSKLATHENGVPVSYLRFDVTDYQDLGKKDLRGWIPVKAEAFEPKRVAMFLEGAVHYMRTFPDRAEEVYESVRASELFDNQLLMFRVCESLEQEPPELGRITAYPPGWLEHASIYTHMSFKWMLELLRAGLYDAFFETLKTSLPPFMKPEIYGRSTLENSSFIVSSAYPDSRLHGQAFQPRLSGVTAEWLQIWTLMVAGPQPFTILDNDELALSFSPAIPDWLFTNEPRRLSIEAFANEVEVPPDSFTFVFLGQVLVTYHNPARKSTWGSDPARIVSGTFEYVDGRRQTHEGSTYTGQVALDVREGRVRRIDLVLA